MAPLEKKGMWLSRLYHHVERENTIAWYVVGMFETAQEAFIEANNYAMDKANQELFKQQIKGENLPNHMVIELLTFGGYPDNVEEQFMFANIADQNGPYMDVHGVTRPSYMMNYK